MHRIPVSLIQPGMQLAQSLYTDKGSVLLAAGATLSEAYIQKLEERGFTTVYVMDGIADDVLPQEIISAHLRQTSTATLKGLYDLVAGATKPVRDEAAHSGAHVLAEQPLKISRNLEDQVAKLYAIAESLLNEVSGAEAVSGLMALKSHDNYTFQHSVDVAVFGAITGHRLGLTRPLLRDLTLGCLLHDIGKTYVDTRILNKQGKLTDEEFALIMEHPQLGFRLLSQLPMESSRARHIVLQHHERQDGAGYPNHLVGNNKLFRTDRERFDPRRISLLAEICAVVDVYSAVVSDRPYREAMTTTEVIDLLRGESGQHLNADIVRLFLGLVQVFPVGSAVRVEGGTYTGYLGVVTKTNRSTPDRPTIRLMFGGGGNAAPEDAEIDFKEQPDNVTLVPLGELEAPLDAYAASRSA